MPEKSKVKIQLNGEFSASDLDEILRDLAAARSGMQPPVADAAPAITSDAEVLEEPNAKFSIRTLANGGLRIWLRHRGFGWLAFTLSAAGKNELVEFLGKKIGHSHTTH